MKSDTKVDALKDVSARRLLRTAEAAAMLGLSEQTLHQKRCQGNSPLFIRLGRTVRYPLDALLAYIDGQPLHRSTSEYGSGGVSRAEEDQGE